MSDHILTIYNHGTGGSRRKDVSTAEIVNLFGNAHAAAPSQNAEYIDFMITEGVAGEGKPSESMIVIDPADGSLKRMNLVKKNAPLEPVSAPLPNNKFKATELFKKVKNLKNAALVTTLTGKGALENVQSVLNVIQWLFAMGTPPTKINMMGWSRGAVTSARIAYQLFHAKTWAADPAVAGQLEKIPVNIFSIDPVAGPGHENEPDVVTLTPNVRNYVATLSLGDDRKGFQPSDLTRIKIVDHAATNAVVLPLAGIHSDTAKWNQPSGHISFNLCYRFLAHHGTPLATGLSQFKQSNAAQLLAYTKMLGDRSTLHAADKVTKRGFWSGLFTGGGKVSRDIDTTLYVGDEFFFNAHHQALFMKEFNNTYRAYFGIGRATRNTTAWKSEWDAKVAGEMVKLTNGEVPDLHALTPEPVDPNEAPRSQVRQKAIAESALID